MNEKQQQLTFDKGITNIPSDALCSDNALEESLGMIYDDGEHRVIQRPVLQMRTNTAFNADMLYIHKYNDKKRYIFVRHIPHSQNPDTLDWAQDGVTGTTTGTFSGIDISDIDKLRITSVGKTLIVTDPSGMHYYLWDVDNDTYKTLSSIPTPDVELYLTVPKSRMGGTRTESSSEPLKITSSNSYEGILSEVQGTITDWRIAEGSSQSVYNDLVVGLYAKNRKVIKQKKCFCEPFFVRTAIELYDGSYTHISQPILLFPAIFTNSYGALDKLKLTLSITTYACELHYINKSHFEDWSDIVKDVVIFITDGIEIYDTSVDQHMPQEFTTNQVVHNGIYRNADTTLSTFHENEVGVSTVTTTKNCWILNQMGDVNNHSITNNHDELINEIESRSIYYKLCAIGRNYEGTDKNVSEKIDTHTLENITTHEQLKYDDYFSRSILLPNFLYSYNSRLNLANVKRNMFEGYGYFMPYDNATYATYTFYVTIKTDNGTKLVRHIEENTYQKQGIWFFYPDSRATHVMILKGQDCILDEDLKEHPSLNGAYYFKGLPTSSEQETPINNAVIPEYTPPTPEYLPNYILTSDVNNPFVFRAEGYYKVGTGKILGMSTITQALSEGQFGQFPLLVFSESGIWSLSVASTGYYDSIHPMSREVCNNVKSITQTDGAVFFTSEKGLMVVVGNQVKCVSEQLSGKEGTFNGCIELGNFHDYLKKCYIAYDYRDSLLWIFSKHTVNSVEVPYQYCWIYSMKSGTFGKYDYSASQVVNDYPDYLISDYTHFDSLVDRPNINLDTRTYSGRLISRPMKLENALALKSIMQIRHMHDMNEDATLTLRIFASNNLKNWVELHSLRGTPWKYYRFRYDFSNLIATDRFAGTMLITQERRTNKLR